MIISSRIPDLLLWENPEAEQLGLGVCRCHRGPGSSAFDRPAFRGLACDRDVISETLGTSLLMSNRNKSTSSSLGLSAKLGDARVITWRPGFSNCHLKNEGPADSPASWLVLSSLALENETEAASSPLRVLKAETRSPSSDHIADLLLDIDRHPALVRQIPPPVV